MAWFVSIATLAAVIGIAIGSIMLIFGRRFIREFTRPGVIIGQATPQWGGWTFPESVVEPPATLQRAVTFQSADGTRLCGEFWAQARSAPTIIISHGFHLPCKYFRSVAALEYSHGANILLFDYRGHGKSALIPTTCGNAEVNDLTAAVNVAASQPETTSGQVYIHGFSMGAAVAILLPPNGAVAGIIADSAYARLDEMIRLLIAQTLDEEAVRWHIPTWILKILVPSLTHLTFMGGRFLFHVRFHRPLVARPDRAIGARLARHVHLATGVRLPAVLLFHAEHDPLIDLHHAQRLVTAARAAGRSIQAHYTPCDIHCGSYGFDPQRYMTLVQKFIALRNAS